MDYITPGQKSRITNEIKIGIVKELFKQDKISQVQFSKLMELQYKKADFGN